MFHSLRHDLECFTVAYADDVEALLRPTHELAVNGIDNSSIILVVYDLIDAGIYFNYLLELLIVIASFIHDKLWLIVYNSLSLPGNRTR